MSQKPELASGSGKIALKLGLEFGSEAELKGLACGSLRYEGGVEPSGFRDVLAAAASNY